MRALDRRAGRQAIAGRHQVRAVSPESPQCPLASQAFVERHHMQLIHHVVRVCTDDDRCFIRDVATNTDVSAADLHTPSLSASFFLLFIPIPTSWHVLYARQLRAVVGKAWA